jgi:hypothetical protein
VGVEGEPVDDSGDEPGVGDHLTPFAERQVGGGGDGGFLFSFGEDLEHQLGAAAVEFDVAELGFAPLDHTGCQLLFRLIAAAYERRSVAIASHSPFEQWGRFLLDQPTTVSLLDRLCHHAHIITTNGDSYRLRHRTTGHAKED